VLWDEDEALWHVGSVGPGLSDFGEWRGSRVDAEGSVGDLLGECGQLGEDFAGADGALPAADDLEASDPLCPVMPEPQVETFRAQAMITGSSGRYAVVTARDHGTARARAPLNFLALGYRRLDVPSGRLAG
jgi:hypothetical protein